MKLKLAILGIMLLPACTPTLQNATDTAVGAITGLTKLEDNQKGALVLSNNTNVVLDQNTVVITTNPGFKSNFCKVRDSAKNIYGCNLGAIDAKKSKVIVYDGSIISGTAFSYDRANRFYAANLVKVK